MKRVNVVVVQQNDNHPFNAGAIRNVAFLEAMKLYPETTWWSIVLSHLISRITFVDVDNVPMDGSVPIEKPADKTLIKVFGHYHSIGGIWSIRVNDFLDVDGYGSREWDDDAGIRPTFGGGAWKTCCFRRESAQWVR